MQPPGDCRAESAATCARIVAAADDVRRRIERDLHDGLQQRLVSLGLRARLASGYVSGADFDRIVNPAAMTGGSNA